MRSGVIVLGGHVQGYGIVRIFGEQKIPSIVIDTTKINIARHSKYCVAFHKVQYNELLEKLIELGKTYKYNNWPIFPTDDYYVRVLSQNKKILEKYFAITVDEWSIINLFYNKRNTYPFVSSVDVPIPKTYYPKSDDDFLDIKDNIGFPCIIKPAIMLDFYRHFKQKVFVCTDINDLNEKFIKATKIIRASEILIQEIIPGSSENQYSVGIFFNRNKSWNHLIARRKRQHPIEFGNATTYAETVQIPLLLEYTERILAKANYFGICEVEFKYDARDGQFKFLEVNPRTWKWHFITERANVPILLSIYKFLVSSNPIYTTRFNEAYWRDLVTDIPVLFQLFVSKKFNLLKSGSPKSEAIFNINDIFPFLYQLLYLPINLFHR